MRTTVHLDADLGERLRQKAAENGLSFKAALNRALAAGLEAWEEPVKPFRVRAKACGLKAGVDWNHLNRMAGELDDEAFAG
jgi:Arc/MetJ family transcription regulator